MNPHNLSQCYINQVSPINKLKDSSKMNTIELKNDYIKEFEPDDAKYLKWINEHPEGFILTSSKNLYPVFTKPLARK